MTAHRLVLVVLALLPLFPGLARADRAFYRGGTWIETSLAVQRLSLFGVLRAWEELAKADAEDLSFRRREAVRLRDCLVKARRSSDELLDRARSLSRAFPERPYYSLSDFLAEAFKDLCLGPDS